MCVYVFCGLTHLMNFSCRRHLVSVQLGVLNNSQFNFAYRMRHSNQFLICQFYKFSMLQIFNASHLIYTHTHRQTNIYVHFLCILLKCAHFPRVYRGDNHLFNTFFDGMPRLNGVVIDTLNCITLIITFTVKCINEKRAESHTQRKQIRTQCMSLTKVGLHLKPHLHLAVWLAIAIRFMVTAHIYCEINY